MTLNYARASERRPRINDRAAKWMGEPPPNVKRAEARKKERIAWLGIGHQPRPGMIKEGESQEIGKKGGYKPGKTRS